MRKITPFILLAVLLWSGFASAEDLHLEDTATLPYGATDYLPLSRGSAWAKVVATILNPCSATAGGTVPTPPNDANKVLNGQCDWVTGGGGGPGTGSVTNAANLANNSIVLGDGGAAGIKTTTTGTGVVTALGINVGNAGAFVRNNGDTLAGTFAFGISTLTGNLIFTGDPKFTGIPAGNIVTGKNLGLDTSNNLVAGTVSGVAGTGSGVDTGTTPQTVTGSTTITSEVVNVATGWATGTLTLPAISTLASAPAPYCVSDAGQNVDASHTLVIQANTADSIGGGPTGAGSLVGPIGTSGGQYCFRVSASHNWTQDGIPTSDAGASQVVIGMGLDGLKYDTQTPARIGASPANHAVPVDVGGVSTYKVIPDCPTGGVGYTQSTDVFGCNAILAAPTYSAALTWAPGINPNNLPVTTIYGSGHVITAVTCRPEVAAGGTATIQLVKAASGTALSAGTVVTTATCNANGTAATNQTLTPSNTSLTTGDTLGIRTTGTTIWTSSGVAAGVITVAWSP